MEKIHKNWVKLLDPIFDKRHIDKLIIDLERLYTDEVVYPKFDDIFRAYHEDPNQISCVIVGQDPYHQKNQAHGLAFSTLSKKLPPSLKNIFKELKDDLNIIKTDGDLTSWANQGVFLINSYLTVAEGNPLSHKDLIWQDFIDNTFKVLNDLAQPMVFILWGKHAQSYQKFLNNPNHLVITSNHPSPLSAKKGFFASKPFSKTNEFLKSKGVKPIDWS